MIKALFYALPLLFVFANVAKAETPSCDWATEIYKTKIGEACQKNLEGKMKDEQDRIYARRIFKEWQPMTGYEVTATGTFFQAVNKTSGDYFQAQWLSYEPAMLYVNGQLVVDESNEPSTFRQIEKLFEKANDQKTAALSPLLKFLAPNEAFAAAAATPRDRVKDTFFLFTIDGKTTTAAELIAKDSDGKVNDGNLKKAGILPSGNDILPDSIGGGQAFKCDASGKGLQESRQKIDGKEVIIKPVSGSRTQFIVSGYPEGKTLKVDMKGTPMLPKEMLHRVKDRHGRPVYRKDGRPLLAYSTPCSGKYNEEINGQCKGAWADLANEKDETGKDKFADAKIFLEKMPKDKDYMYGKDIKCEKVFDKDVQKQKDCRKYFFSRFQPGKQRFEEGQAEVAVCDGIDCRKTKKMEDGDIAVGPAAPPMSPSERMRFEIGARQAYVAALKADPKRPASVDPLKVCPIGVGNVNGRGPREMSEFQKCDKIPYATPSQAVKDAYEAQQAGPEENRKEEAGDAFRSKLDNRLLGVMMMGECCGNKVCADMLSAKHNIKLDGAKSAQ